MRNVVASLFISLDGVIEAPEEWHFPYFNDEMGAAIGQGIKSSDAFLLGRKTYDEWAQFWPAQDPGVNPMAHAMNGMPKFVVSQTLDAVDWQNSQLLNGDLADEVARLKGEGGNEIGISGSATLVRSLLQDGLLDELRLLVHPVVVGKGARLFDDVTASVPLELVGSETFTTGVVNLSYRPLR